MLEALIKAKVCDNYPVIVERWCKSITHEVMINSRYNYISFKLQLGARKVAGPYGCDIDTMIKACQIILSGLQNRLPCDENQEAIFHITEAYLIMKRRKKDRESRGVEGTYLK